ncbi:MAG: T9SS type A sorting domain-containing protein [Rhodothermales bacterium]
MKCRTAACKTAEPQKERLKVVLFLLLAFYFSLCASAQVGTCEPAQAQAILDAGNARALILNDGALFTKRQFNAPNTRLYEIPKGTGLNSLYISNVWIGGLIDEELHISASLIGPQEFWPGPLDINGNPPSDCAVYDKIWEIRRADLQMFIDTGDISNNLRDWPWQLGAPVVDADGNPDNYNLDAGDLPELLGDQRLWWVMNDRGNAHGSTNSEPIGLEVHGSAFSFGSPVKLANVTFFTYKLINKNKSALKKAYFGMYSDVDLGNYDDDYIGSDSLLHLVYGYNDNNIDEGGYGEAPPAIGYTLIQTAFAEADGLDNDRDGLVDEPGEMIGTSSAMENLDDGIFTSGPRSAQDYYYRMQGRWKDGAPIYEGLHGYYYGAASWPANLPLKTTRFFYSGDPTTKSFWTMFDTGDEQGQVLGADIRMDLASGPFDILPGHSVDITAAIVWARGDNHLDSVKELKGLTFGIRESTGELLQPVIPAPTQVPVHLPTSLGFSENFPNPFAESTTLRYSLPQSMQVRLAVFDMLGREVEVLVEQQQDAGLYTINFEAGTLPSGIYLARIELDHLRFTKRMVLAR